jgi:ubiquinol-cytochrome c reductase iron-sulfur subunit
MLFFAFITTLYVLISGIGNHSEQTQHIQHPPVRISLSQVSESTPQRVVWAGGNLILIRRNEALLNRLPHHNEQLLDPQSLSADQPTTLPSPERSLRPDIFLAFDRGTDMGCPLNWVPAGHRKAPLQPWPGGFRDNCRGSWYDAAGRVFREQEAQRNLSIPQYRIVGEDLLEVGGSGDNAAPAN